MSKICVSFKKHKKLLISLSIILLGTVLITMLFLSLSEKGEIENNSINNSDINNKEEVTNTIDGRMSGPIIGKQDSEKPIKLNDDFQRFGNSNSVTCTDTETVTSYTDHIGTTSGLSSWYSPDENGNHVTGTDGDYTDYCCDEENDQVTYDLVNCYTEYGDDYRCEEGKCVGGYYDLELSTFYAVPKPGVQSIYVLFNVNINGDYTGDELVSVGDYWIQSTGDTYYVDPIEGTNLRPLARGDFISIEGTFDLS